MDNSVNKVNKEEEDYKVNNMEITDFNSQYNQVARQLKKQKKAEIAEEKEEEQNDKRIAEFREIDVTAMEFFKTNLRTRHIFSTPICFPSIFNPRYKKLMLLVTQLSVECLVISLLMTNNVDPFSKNTSTDAITNVQGLIGYAIVAVVIGNLVCYSLAWMFRLPIQQRHKLYTIVKSGLEMQILKEW